MDNASKALVMAGAILIAVMLISLGVLLFNQAQNTATGMGATVDAMKLQAYNSTFTNYTGSNKTASEVKGLISRIITHNANQEERTTYGNINCTFNSNTAITTPITVTVTSNAAPAVNIPTAPNAALVRESSYYCVAVTSYNSLGAVSGIRIDRQNAYFAN